MSAMDNRDANDLRASFAYRSVLSRGLDVAAADAAYTARVNNGPYMTAWDGVSRGTPAEEYLKRARGGLDEVRGDQWGYRVAQSLPDAALNEAGGAVVRTGLKLLTPGVTALRGAVLGEESLLRSELNTLLNPRYAGPLPGMTPIEGISPSVGANRMEPTLGVLDDSVFAQVPAKSTKAFSEEGQKVYSQVAGRPIKTVNDLAEALKQGVVAPSQVPLDYVVIDGQKVIANTRSSTALINAEIPKSLWYGVDKTGIKAYGDVTFDDLVRNQLNKNYGGSVQKARK